MIFPLTTPYPHPTASLFNTIKQEKEILKGPD